MPRNYVAKPGAKRYKKYDELVMKQALDNLANNSLSVVAEKFNISKSVLCRHKKSDMKPHGRPIALSNEEESFIVEKLNICGDWGYPLDTADLRYIIKTYLDSRNIKHRIFKNNIPGIDYINGFLKRHANKISQRICQNIKRSRTAVSPDTIKEYFSELEKSLENVPTQNIINYDETNLTDDPGRKNVIVKRGCKYPERIVNHSKGSISLMMAATAYGDFLPPYVVYKAAHLYNSWTTGGPENARYNRSSSGWFDGDSFEDWVKTIVIPFIEKKKGKKVLIGDNLSSHLSIDVIKLCQEKDIHFIFLPANSTHLTQPLDVAVFRPMKMIWRQLLDKWKKSDDGRTQSCVPKGCFPMLLKLQMNQLRINGEKNISAGFRKCGIVPLDAQQVLNRLPLEVKDNEEATKPTVNDSFFNFLKEMRYGSMNIKEPKTKRKLDVVAGKSVSAEELERTENLEPEKPKKKKIKKQPTETTSSLKGKGIGKKTKLKIAENNNFEVTPCDQSKNVNVTNIIDMPVGLSDPNAVMIPAQIGLSIEDMPIIFMENFDGSEITVETEDESQEILNTTLEEKRKEFRSIENRPRTEIKIISDIKLKLPLPLNKTNSNSTLQNSQRSNLNRLKPKRRLNFYKDTEEILIILEE